MIPYCAACGTVVPDLSGNHHVCIDDGKGGHIATTRDAAQAAHERAEREGTTVAEAYRNSTAVRP